MTTLAQLLTLSAPSIIRAYSVLTGKTPTTKSVMAQELAALIEAGVVTFDNVRDAANASPHQPPLMATPSADTAAADVLQLRRDSLTLAQQVKSDLSRIDAGLATVVRGVKQAQDDQTRLAADLSALRQHREQPVDKAEITAAIAAAVTAEFGKFKQTIVDAGLQSAAADAAAVSAIGSDTCAAVFNIDVRDIRGNPLRVTLYNAPDAPAIDQNFVWTEGILKHLLLADANGEHLWFGGERGTGKTETARQFAARTGRSFTRINFHKYSTGDEYLGCTGLVNGATEFVDGDFLRAYATPGAVVLLDEITNAPAGELAPLNALLEPNAAVHLGGKVRRRAAGVLVLAADNTLGNGDTSGRYTGTGTMNTALLDRFARVVEFKHMSMTQEIDAVCRHTGCTRELAEAVLSAVAVARANAAKGEIVDAPSIRQVLAFIRSVKVLGVNQAWETCIATRQPDESRIGLNAIKAAALNASTIENLI